MVKEESGLDDDAPMTVTAAHRWLSAELEHGAKALELRLRDASEVVGLFAARRLTSAEFYERQERYTARWGDSLPFSKAPRE